MEAALLKELAVRFADKKLVVSKNGSRRISQRAVNSVTQSLPHPLPRVDDALDSLAGAKIFSTLDMASGYWQVDLAEEDKEKTAFSTGRGLHRLITSILRFCQSNS